jgi:hypothetical protein
VFLRRYNRQRQQHVRDAPGKRPKTRRSIRRLAKPSNRGAIDRTTKFVSRVPAFTPFSRTNRQNSTIDLEEGVRSCRSSGVAEFGNIFWAHCTKEGLGFFADLGLSESSRKIICKFHHHSLRPLLRHIASFYVRLFFSTARRGAQFGVGWAAGPRSSWTFLLLKRSISTDSLLYRNRSRSACVAIPCFTCFSRFASASL